MIPRAMRLAAIGASIGSVAMILFTALAYLLHVAVNAFWELSIPDLRTASALPSTVGITPLVGHVAGLLAAAAGAGAAAGVAVVPLRVSVRADSRALVVSLVATLGFLFMSAWAIGDAFWLPQRTAALGIVGLGVGALAWAGLWTQLATALQQAAGVTRAVWAGARRLVGFALGLFGALGAALLGPFAVGILVRAVLGQLRQDALAAGLGTIAVFALSLGTSILGFYAAGVPRPWRQRLNDPPTSLP